MYIESIEIYGFKTFVNNTKFVLSEHITCIVGPNGSGKSNIVDAIRFLFGENRLSLLRAEDLSYLIFAGSGNRPPLSVASVKAIINNEDRGISSVKTPRVVIERRIFKGRESRYYINGEESSLSNLLEVFRSAGIFGITHAIVGQGKVEELVLAKPEEKKNMIDRIAGIEIMRKKRDEASKKLYETEDNLDKVKSIYLKAKEEYEHTLEEAQKVHIYYTLLSKEKEVEGRLYSLRLKRVKDTLNNLKIGLDEKMNERNAVYEEILRLKGKFEEVHREFVSTEELVKRLKDEQSQILLKKAQIENSIENLRDLLGIKEGEMEDLNIRFEKLEKTKSYITIDLNRRRVTLKELEKDLEEVTVEEGKLKISLENKVNELLPLEEAYEAFKKAVSEVQNKRIQIEKKISAFEREFEIKKRRVEELTQKIGALEDFDSVDTKALESRRGVLKDRIVELQGEIGRLTKEEAVLNYRLNKLGKEPEETLLDGEDTLKNMLHIDKTPSILKEFLEGVVVGSVEEIKERASKRFFIDVPCDENNFQRIPALKTVSELLSVDSKFLTGIYYTETLEEGVEAFSRYFGTFYIREIITGDGFVILSPFEVERKECEKVEEYEHLQKEKERFRERISELTEELNSVKGEEGKIGQYIIEVEGKVKERTAYKDEYDSLKNECDTLSHIIESLKGELKGVLGSYPSFDESRLVFLRNEIDRIKEDIRKTSVRRREIELKCENVEREIKELEGRSESIARELKDIEEKKKLLEREMKEGEKEVERKVDLLNSVVLSLKEMEEKIKESDKKYEALKEKEATISVEIVRNEDIKEGIEGDIEKIKISIAKEEANLENLLNEMKEKDLKECAVSGDMDEANLKGEVMKIKREIEKLMPLDFTSVEREGELRQSFEEKKVVYEDIVGAKRELEKYIKELDNTIKESFERTFKKLNEAFNNIFLEIFEGGMASLEQVYNEEGEISGIELSVKLPFKRKQPLSVLSGGEKSLVSLAFLFAMFEVNPSPFYVLDEVDAALDDENVEKFGKLLLSISKRSQLIIITHNKKTMEKGNILYGITMEEDGVSKVVSLKLV